MRVWYAYESLRKGRPTSSLVKHEIHFVDSPPSRGEPDRKRLRYQGAPMPNKSSRLTVNLSEELVESLREMAARSGTTMTDVLKRAIAVQQFLEEQQDEGKKLLMEDPKGNTIREL